MSILWKNRTNNGSLFLYQSVFPLLGVTQCQKETTPTLSQHTRSHSFKQIIHMPSSSGNFVPVTHHQQMSNGGSIVFNGRKQFRLPVATFVDTYDYTSLALNCFAPKVCSKTPYASIPPLVLFTRSLRYSIHALHLRIPQL